MNLRKGFDRLLKTLHQDFTDPIPESPEYQLWRRRFMLHRLRLINGLAILGYSTFMAMELLKFSTGKRWLGPDWLVMVTIVELCLVGCWVTSYTRFGKHRPGGLLLAMVWAATLVEQVWATWRGEALLGLFSWTLSFLSLAVLVPVRWKLHWIAQAGVLAYYFGVNTLLQLPPRNAGLSLGEGYVLYLFWFCFICDLAVFLYERLQKAQFEANRQLQLEQAKSERLLLNILPEVIAHQLKTEQKATIADSFGEVSVLFADIVGFTALSTTIPPVEMVGLLNQLFSAFDELAEQHQLEKIKTIGDAYMVVGGLPIERADHAEAIANMALDMQQAVIQFNAIHNHSFSLRIGIHTGPVVAGVIGIKKFIYDLWGDTVNTASRMESHGVADHIQVTAATYDRLQPNYHFQERGIIQVKGKGDMRTYFLLGKRSTTC